MMKRFLLFVLAVIMLAMPLVGCSSPQNAASGDQSGTLQTGANSNEQSGSAGVGIVGNGQGNSSGDDSAVTGTIKNTGGIFFRPGTAGTGDVTPYSDSINMIRYTTLLNMSNILDVHNVGH